MSVRCLECDVIKRILHSMYDRNVSREDKMDDCCLAYLTLTYTALEDASDYTCRNPARDLLTTKVRLGNIRRLVSFGRCRRMM